MSRPLLISDCDEVLLHMIGHFADWIGDAHGMDFALDTHDFREAVSYKDGRGTVPAEVIWPMLDSFFDSEMRRQNVVPGAVAALAAIGEVADIVILTNLGDQHQASRVEQLAAFDIRHSVLCNRGGKGRPVRELIDTLQPSVAVFVDDLPVHHQSVAADAPEVWRLHMIAEPRVAAHVPPAPDAHARIDDWAAATPWILARFSEGAALR